MIEELRKQAKVEVLIPVSEEKPKAQAPASTEEGKAAEQAKAEEKTDKSGDAPAEGKSETAQPAVETAKPAESAASESAEKPKAEPAAKK